MTLKNVIDIADEICPNTFSNNMKTMWVNECEGIVQTEVLLLEINNVRAYQYAATPALTISFPDDHTIRFTEPCGFSEGGTIKLAGLVTYANNNSNVAIPIVDVSQDGLTAIFNEGTWTDTGDTEEACNFTYDGSESKLLVLPPHDKLYYPYLCAMIELAMHEYSKYENYKEEFNQRLGEYTRWFSLYYKPANMRRV